MPPSDEATRGIRAPQAAGKPPVIMECSLDCSCRKATPIGADPKPIPIQESALQSTATLTAPSTLAGAHLGPVPLAWVLVGACFGALFLLIVFLSYRLRRLAKRMDQVAPLYSGHEQASVQTPAPRPSRGNRDEALPLLGYPQEVFGRGGGTRPPSVERGATRPPATPLSSPLPARGVETAHPLLPAPAWRTLEEAEPLLREAYNGSRDADDFSARIEQLGFTDQFAIIAPEDERRTEEHKRWVLAKNQDSTTLLLLPSDGSNGGFLVPVLQKSSHAHAFAYGMTDIIQAIPGGLVGLAFLTQTEPGYWKVTKLGEWRMWNR